MFVLIHSYKDASNIILEKQPDVHCPNGTAYLLQSGQEPYFKLETINKFGVTIYPKWVKYLLAKFGIKGKSQLFIGHKYRGEL